MLPRDPQDSSATERPSESPMPLVNSGPGDADPATRPFSSPGPVPTGLVDQPLVTPVLVAPAGRPRGWPFAIAMVLVAVMAGGALFMSGFMVGRDNGRVPSGSLSEAEAWEPFWDVYDAVTQRYPLEPVERQTLIEGAIRGMVEAVGDPYSSYLSPADFRGTLDDISGTFEGIGAEIGSVDAAGNTSDCATYGPDCFLVIIAPLEGSPAEKAGLRPGDVIFEVDGSRLDGLTPDEARDRVRGEAGTEVRLHILRFEARPAGSPAPVSTPVLPTPAVPTPAATEAPTGSDVPGGTAAPSGSAVPGSSGMPPLRDPTPAPSPSAPVRELLEEFEVTVVREKIQRREVVSRELADGTVGYVRLSGFSSNGAMEFEAALKAHVDAGIRKIVFDLRGNPGGFLLDSLDVASEFIGEGPIYWQEDAQGNQTVSDARAGGVATDPSIQVVVLIDRGSASASEIVAGALQDRKRAQLIGETSFGKGTVQEWLDLGEVGGVRLTVWKWLTPDKRWIHRVGLTPDIPVTIPADLPSGDDPVLDKALEVLGGGGAARPKLLGAA